MTYQEAVQYLFSATPVYQHVGGAAYKPGLGNTERLDAHYGHPHRAYPTIHIAGTNGKGSTSHTLSAILQAAGYRVGLFTSPHLVDFRERIRVSGQMISEDYVARFTEEAREQVREIEPSFFELTTLMALCYFRDMQVDVAIIEVGLGGRLDSTNIISPILSIITNISLDHTQYLGHTLREIATEKAGIIKPHTPVVIGNSQGEGVRSAITRIAVEQSAPLHWAELYPEGYTPWGEITPELKGDAQRENTATILTALEVIARRFDLTAEAVQRGFAEVTRLSGLRGRWEELGVAPLRICDTGHNVAGITLVVQQLRRLAGEHRRIRVVLGMASDKDVASVIALFPPQFDYYFTQASVPRAMPADELQALAHLEDLEGGCYPSVAEAYQAALDEASPEDVIFVGGSNFVVADLLTYLQSMNN